MNQIVCGHPGNQALDAFPLAAFTVNELRLVEVDRLHEVDSFPSEIYFLEKTACLGARSRHVICQ